MSNQLPQKICRGKACCRTIFFGQNIPHLVQICLLLHLCVRCIRGKIYLS